MRRGHVRRLHAGCGFIVGVEPGRRSEGAKRKATASYFFAPCDCDGGGATFDALREGDPVEYEIVEPEPPRGPRALAVRRAA